jgi:hypothetical protein
MWSKILKIALYLLPYLPTAIDFLLRKFKIKKLTIVETKIEEVAKIIDDKIDFVDISKGIKNVIVKGVVASVEMFDGTIFEMGLKELIDLVPENKKWIVEKYLDAVIANNWLAVKDTTADVINVFVDIPGANEDEEKEAYASMLVLMFMFIKSKISKK